MIRLCLLGALAGPLLGCGLIDPDITDFDLSLPAQEFVVDSVDWGVNIEGVDGERCHEVPSINCTPSPAICTAPGTVPCDGTNCVSSCGVAGTCEVEIEVQLWSTIDLAKEKPELSRIADQPIIDVTLKRVTFTVSENTLTVSTPELSIFVGGESVMSVDSPQAKKVGSIPSIAPGELPSDVDLTFTRDGKDHLKSFMRNYLTSFNIIVGGTTTFAAGDCVPQGILRAEINATATAGL